jgi:PncC family amidohydrolase
MIHQGKLGLHARKVAALLQATHNRLVLAESCTGGMVAAALAGVPGISDCLCGSAVTYRNDTKRRWLSVPVSILKKQGPVSEETTAAMALGALEKTPEASVAAAVTGYLGPHSPQGQDGRLFIAVALKAKSGKKRTVHLCVEELQLAHVGTTTTQGKKKTKSFFEKQRLERQLAASHAVLFMVRSLLEAAKT